MDTIQITKEKLNKFVIAAKYYVGKNTANKSLLWIHLSSILELALKKLKKVEQQKDLVKVKFCKKDSRQFIEYDKKGNYQYNEENYKKLLDALEDIDNELVDLPAGLIVPKGQYPEKTLSYDLRDAFKGIVIPVEEYNIKGMDPEAIQKMLDKENERIEKEPDEETEEQE